MNNKAMLYGIIGFLGGILIAILFTTNVVNSNNTSMMKMMGMKSRMNSMVNSSENKNEHMMPDGSKMSNQHSMTMEDMVEMLEGKSGDEFDKAFIEGMIEHHEGAVDMAELAQQYAGHDEIKMMAEDIISAQTKEIDMMKSWQTAWGY